MIGTNNLGSAPDEEIVEGLEFLLEQIKIRQPEAKIKVVGLLPRRNKEADVKAINRQISKMASLNNYSYLDVGNRLLTKNGKIDESLFLDGLHPNEKGYSLIVNEIIE
jgi:lysophospholipase L1-like esterase